MVYKKNIFIIILVFIFSVVTVCAKEKPKIDIKGKYDYLSSKELSRILGWVSDKDKGKLCCGYYSEPDNIVNFPDSEPFTKSPLNIKANQPALITKNGPSVIEGDVVLTQPGREILADKVTFYRDDETGKISRAVLTGNVSYCEHGKLIVADSSDLDFANGVYSLDSSIYRLRSDTPTGIANVWGKAKAAISEAAGVLKLKNSTYTTCSPENVSWYLKSSRLRLDSSAGRGYARNAVVFFKKVPIFYSPFLSFPINKERKSGFLTPTPSYSKDSGFSIDLPYYFNLAPNYDFTFTPELLTRRGLVLGGNWRYMTLGSKGYIDANYIPKDKVFMDFRNSASASNGSDKNALKELKNSSDGRAFFSLQNISKINENWDAKLDVNYVTDDYFMQDFRDISNISDRDQLLNRADIRYNDNTWSFLTRVQAFQTLHPITQNEAQDQYRRLPQVSLSGDFPDSYGGLDYRLDTEITNFTHRDDFYSRNSTPVTAGTRFNFMPSISLPLSWMGGYFLPKVHLQTTGYALHDRAITGVSNRVARFYPIFSLDSGAVFTRKVDFLKNKYTQTLEPRLFYLFVPEREQDSLPLFDTSLPAFDFSQLFRVNRFSGIDRVGDANQFVFAITARMLDDYGQEKFTSSIGQMVALRRHEVEIDRTLNQFAVDSNLDPLVNDNFSPLVGNVQYNINSNLSASVNAAWNVNKRRFNTATVNMRYTNSSDRVLNLWYNYALNGDRLLQNEDIDLSRVGASLSWKTWSNFNIIGNVNYNISYKRPQSYFYGLEYNSCCFAIRAMHSRNFIGVGSNKDSNYDSKFYLQILLKGIGSFGDNGLGELIKGQVGGYSNKFD